MLFRSVTDHLKTFGALEVSRRQYHKLLEASLVGEADFAALSRKMTGVEAMQYAEASSSP